MSFFDTRVIPSESILTFKAQALARSRTENPVGMLAPKVNPDDASKAPLLELYDKHKGDISAIFAELGDHPGKALKYPPENADEFATKYMGGYYTYIDLKAVMEKAGLEYHENENLMNEPPRHLGVVRNKLDLPESEVAKEDNEVEEPAPTNQKGKLGITADVLNAKRVTLIQRRSTQTSLARKKLLVGPTEDETAPLIALYHEYEGNMTGIFSELGESPRKALKYPPKDANDFANQFIAGKLTDYAAPKIKEGFDEVMMRPDRATTPFQALASVFPNLPHEVIYAVLEASNGSLDAAVDILLESGLHLWDDNDTPSAPPNSTRTSVESSRTSSETAATPAGKKEAASAPPVKPSKSRPAPKTKDRKKQVGKAASDEQKEEEAKLSALQERNLNRQMSEAQEQEDYVLAITVPPGSGPNALLKITTTIGTVHARVPSGVQPGQSFFIRLRCGRAGKPNAEAI